MENKETENKETENKEAENTGTGSAEEENTKKETGKGVPASLFMAVSKTMLKNRTVIGGTPSAILTDVNNWLCEGNDSCMFVTVWFDVD